MRPRGAGPLSHRPGEGGPAPRERACRAPRSRRVFRGTLTVPESGEEIPAAAVMYSAGRPGLTEGPDLGRAGLSADARGRIAVDGRHRTRP
ncbi:hypothetical protein GCM10010421_36760 [Streptomyces glaucus]|uniref:Uncharacterized protein n=1 Tax=Streptomyces glaucus TaxID=284029 RepID=A0ABN3JXW9_9ACTN